MLRNNKKNIYIYIYVINFVIKNKYIFIFYFLIGLSIGWLLSNYQKNIYSYQVMLSMNSDIFDDTKLIENNKGINDWLFRSKVNSKYPKISYKKRDRVFEIMDYRDDKKNEYFDFFYDSLYKELLFLKEENESFDISKFVPEANQNIYINIYHNDKKEFLRNFDEVFIKRQLDHSSIIVSSPILIQPDPAKNYSFGLANGLILALITINLLRKRVN